MGKKNLVSINDFSRDEILKIMELAAGFEADPHQQVLAGKVIASLFFEPSTRTRLSFESAINHLGGRVIGFSDTSNTSVSKGETFHDTITVISNYCDMIVMRHYIEGAARYASEISKVPVVNAGDGANQHPSQTLLDLFSIKKTQGRLDNINIMMVGDLKYGRTVHSLLQALSHFNPTFTFVAPEELRMPDEYKLFLKEKGIAYTETERIEEGIKEADIVYMTRVQRERFSDPMEYERVKHVYILKNSMLEGTNENMRILCRGWAKSPRMWTRIRKHTISSRPKTAFTRAWQSSATCWGQPSKPFLLRMTMEGTLEVRAIENGTVIDHIPANSLFKIIKILGLDTETHRITFGMNLESKRMGTKAIIKINERFCQQEEINRIAIVAPMAAVNIIKNYDVVEKRAVEVPETIEGFVRCANPKCITNMEPVRTSFTVIHGDEISLRCKYCEKITHQNSIEITK